MFNEQIIRKILTKVLRTVFSKAKAKTIIKKIPLAGMAVGAFSAFKCALNSDWTGASLELASGAVSTIPGIGTAASTALDIGLLVK